VITNATLLKRQANGIPLDKPKYLHTARLLKATDDQIVDAYRSGLSMAKIAEKFGVDEWYTVKRALERHHVAIRRVGRYRKA
jgi:transposase-like protein